MDVDWGKQKLSLITENKEIEQIGADLNSLKITEKEYLNNLEDKKEINLENYTKITERNDSALINRIDGKSCEEIKIGFFGEENSGKSTLVGVLVNGNLDNGEGSARQNIFRFQHELQCGKTSSLSHQIIGFDKNGEILNSLNWEEIMQNSSKLISFYDLGGSEKASKTTLSTISPNYIDYFFLVISAKQGITDNTKILLILADSLELPIITLITMTDLVDTTNLEELIKTYKCLIKNLKIKKFPLIVNSDDISLFSRNLNEKINPIFIISNKNGEGINYLIKFLSIIPKIENYSYINKINDKMCQFDIHEHFILEKEISNNNNNKLIVGGIVSLGRIMVGQKYYLGPDKTGNFKIVEVEDIHCKKASVKSADEGQFSSLSLIKSLQPLKIEDVRKGMSLLDVNYSFPNSCKSFQAEIWSIDGVVRSVKNKYEPVVTIRHVRQTCRIRKLINIKNDLSDFYNSESIISNLDMETDYEDSYDTRRRRVNKNTHTSTDEIIIISPDEKIILNFEFKNYPEFVTVGSHLIINENNLKAFGIIMKINS